MKRVKKIFAGVMVVSIFFLVTSTSFAQYSPCAAIPQQYKDSWNTLSQENQGTLMRELCNPSNVSTGPSVSTKSEPLVSTKLENPIKYDTFSEFAEAVIRTAVIVLIPFVVIGFMIAGFLFIKAQGNTEEISKAKTAMWYSIVGAFILLGSLGFAQIIGSTVSTLTN